MATQNPEWQAPKPKKAVMQWLLDSDPSIRWQVMRDLTEEPDEFVAGERSRVASEGWGARLLDLQGSDGNWGDDIAIPHWRSNLYTLLLWSLRTRASMSHGGCRWRPAAVSARVRDNDRIFVDVERDMQCATVLHR